MIGPSLVKRTFPQMQFNAMRLTLYKAQTRETGQTATPGIPSPTLRNNSASHVMLKTQDSGPAVCSYIHFVRPLTMTLLALLNLNLQRPLYWSLPFKVGSAKKCVTNVTFWSLKCS